jgi:cardiolipin synthase
MEALLGVPATEGNAVSALRNGIRIFPAMLDAIGAASHTVDLLSYVYWTGWPAQAFADALSERAEAGVRVRVLIDAVGGAKMDRALVARMRDAGAQVEFFRVPFKHSPFKYNHRTHRKVLVVDGAVGFTGGVGIAREWEGDARGPDEWRDTQVEIRGPAVACLAAAFVQNWSEATRHTDDPDDVYPVLPVVGDAVVQIVRGTATLGWDDIQTAWYGLLSAATERLTLQTAYFAPDSAFREILCEAAGRGVSVEVLLPGPYYDKVVSRLESERHYAELLDAGLRLWRFQPTMLHTKVLTVDERIAMIGSSNLNQRSLEHDEEVTAIVYGGGLPQELAEHFAEDVARSVEVLPERWRRRPRLQRLGELAVAPLHRYL